MAAVVGGLQCRIRPNLLSLVGSEIASSVTLYLSNVVLKETRTSTTLEALRFGVPLPAFSASLILENTVLDINHRCGIMKKLQCECAR